MGIEITRDVFMVWFWVIFSIVLYGVIWLKQSLHHTLVLQSHMQCSLTGFGMEYFQNIMANFTVNNHEIMTISFKYIYIYVTKKKSNTNTYKTKISQINLISSRIQAISFAHCIACWPPHSFLQYQQELEQHDYIVNICYQRKSKLSQKKLNILKNPSYSKET